MTSTAKEKRKRWGRLTGIVLVNIATLTWATNVTLGRWLRDDIGPLTLAASRFLIASSIFVLFLQRQPPRDRRPGRDRWLLVGMAISGVVLFSPLLYLGLRLTSVINATLINGLGPLITGVLAAFLIQETMSRRQVTGAVVGLAGVVILITNGSLAIWEAVSGNVGDLIVLGAVSLWALYSVLGRKVMHNRSALSATALSDFIGLPFLILAAIWEMQSTPADARPGLILAIVYIGIAPTVIGFLSWNAGVRRLGASGAMVFYNTLPLYGGLLAYLLLGESVGLASVVGGGLIIGGGLWAAKKDPAP